MTKYIPYLVYLWLLGMHQVFFKDLTSILGATINLTILIVLLLAIHKSEVVVIWFGFFAGLVSFAATSTMLGWHVLIITIIGLIACQIKNRLNLDSLYAKLLLVLGGVSVHNILTLALSQTDDFLWLILVKTIPGAIYTSIIAYLYFVVKEGKVTPQKIKSIF